MSRERREGPASKGGPDTAEDKGERGERAGGETAVDSHLVVLYVDQIHQIIIYIIAVLGPIF